MPADNKQQELYTIFVAQCIKIARQIKIPQTPEGIAETIVNIITRVETEGEKKGVKFDLAIKFNGAEEILAWVLEKSGMEFDEETVKQIVQLMVGMYLKNSVDSGRMTKEEVVQLAQQSKGTITGAMGKRTNG